MSGLHGGGLTLNAGTSPSEPNLAVTAGATQFLFANSLPAGTAYNITVAEQPSSPVEFCTVVDGSGLVGANISSVTVTCSSTWLSISAGTSHTLGIRPDGSLWAWGDNASGQLGTGSSINEDTPFQVMASTTFTAVSAGANHTLAIADDGTLWAFGNNSSGQLGNGTNASSYTPVQVTGGPSGSLSYWVFVAAGDNSSAAIQYDGSLWVWGDNTFGQLGDGTQTSQNTPELLTTGPACTTSGTTSPCSWVWVALGTGHAVAVSYDGTVWVWGDNTYGQLGDGTNTAQLTPEQLLVASKPLVAGFVYAGSEYTLVTTSSGLLAFGDNTYGQLGDGTTVAKNAPEMVLNGIFTSVSAGASHVAVVKDDSTLWVWGDNTQGDVGNDTITQQNTPAEVGTPPFEFAAAGGSSTFAIGPNGALFAFGDNTYGELGDGTHTSQNTPEPIP